MRVPSTLLTRPPAQAAGLCLLLSILSLGAQTLPPEVAEKFAAYTEQSVNAMVLFSSEQSISSGYYTVDGRNGDRDAKFSAPKLSARHSFGEATNRLRAFIEGTLGQFKLTEDVVRLGTPADHATFTAYSLAAGGGVHWNLGYGFTLSPGFAAGYSRLEQDYEYRNAASSALRPFIQGVLVNWNADAVNLRPFLELNYEYPAGPVVLGASSKYAFLYTDIFSSSSAAVTTDARTHFWRNELKGVVTPGWTVAEQPLNFGLGLSRYDLFGQSFDTLDITNYYEIRGDIFASLRKRILKLKAVGVSASLFFGGRLNGWRAGLYYDF